VHRFLFLLLLFVPLQASLDAVKAEPNLEKRAAKALDNADEQIGVAKKAYDDGEQQAFLAAVNEVAESVELSYQSLSDTGKRARRDPKHFKRAELKTRTLIRRLDGLEKAVGLEDREQVSAALKKVHEIHDQLVTDIMTKK
jgi:hypothetical protein